MDFHFQTQQVRKHGAVAGFTRDEARQLVIFGAEKGYKFGVVVTVYGYTVTDEDD